MRTAFEGAVAKTFSNRKIGTTKQLRNRNGHHSLLLILLLKVAREGACLASSSS